jgi:L-alanine-DL-glutamate epimerase-like enolase superfamily enzyme
MKIREVSCFRVDMELAAPYTIAYETVTRTSNVILKLVTDTGLIGWGCAAPDMAVTGESTEDVLAAANGVVKDMLTGSDPFQIARYTYDLKKKLPNMSSTLAMTDIALFDLLARKADLPLYMLLGGFRKRIATSITIGILPLDETLAEAERQLKKGFFIFKLKGGIHLDEDVEKILKLRESFGSDFFLRFDANQGFSAAQTEDFIRQVKSAHLELIEQPTCRTRDESLGQVTQAVSIPVMADESIRTLSDAFRLTSNEFIDMINIKLMKMGGIFESLHINSVAKAAGVEVMVGCLDESSLGISAGLHFALSRANIEYADLDGHLDLVGDPFTGLFRLKDGWLYPTDAPGLGKISI